MTAGELANFLSRYYPLPQEFASRLSELLKSETYRKKSFLLREGQICNNIMFVERGLIRIFYVKDGIEICSGLLCEGSVVISIHSFFNRAASYEYIQALEDTVVQYISYDEMESLYREFNEFNIVGRKLIQEYYVRSEDRNYLLRRLSAKEKYQYFKTNLGHLLPRVPRKDIASYLGINLETLSRLSLK